MPCHKQVKAAPAAQDFDPSQGTEQVWQYLPPLCQSSYLSSGHASDQNALTTRVQYSVFAGMVEFMRAAGETCTQEHDEDNVTADAKHNLVDEFVRGRFAELETSGHR